MAVLDRSELEASPLADLHAIADEIGLDGFRRLRKADLIDKILGEKSPAPSAGEEPEEDPDEAQERPARTRRRRPRARRAGGDAGTTTTTDDKGEDDEPPAASPPRERAETAKSKAPESAEGVVEVLANGSGFLRVNPPEPSDEDVYISAAQVRRCELVSGDRVAGPVRTPRRSERYPSMVRIDTINGEPADKVADGARYDDLPVAWPSERLAFGAEDPTLEAIEWLTPLGRGSRAVIVGPPRSGKTEVLRRMLKALAAQEGLEVTLVVAGARPEEIAEWQEGSPAPLAATTFAAAADQQGQGVERAVEAGRRVASRGGHAVVLVDGLDGLHPHAARRVLAAARNLRDGGSLTVIASASQTFGGETTVIALDPALTGTGRQPIVDLAGSGTLRLELLVGEDGAEAVTRARAAAIEGA
jgi:transcription termination factor Rho